MKFYIKHSIKGRLRVHMDVKRMTYKQADILEYYLKNVESVYEVKVYEKTCDVVISYTNDKKYIVRKLLDFSYDSVQVPDDVVSSRRTSPADMHSSSAPDSPAASLRV